MSHYSSKRWQKTYKGNRHNAARMSASSVHMQYHNSCHPKVNTQAKSPRWLEPMQLLFSYPSVIGILQIPLESKVLNPPLSMSLAQFYGDGLNIDDTEHVSHKGWVDPCS